MMNLIMNFYILVVGAVFAIACPSQVQSGDTVACRNAEVKVVEIFKEVYGEFDYNVVFDCGPRIHFHSRSVPAGILDEMIDLIKNRKKCLERDGEVFQPAERSLLVFRTYSVKQALIAFAQLHHLEVELTEDTVVFGWGYDQYSIYAFHKDELKIIENDPRYEPIFEKSVMSRWESGTLVFLLCLGAEVGRFSSK